jgi:hypothetical protein
MHSRAADDRQPVLRGKRHVEISTSPLGVGRADAPRLRPRRAGVPTLWRAATVDHDCRGSEAIRAILATLAGSREREDGRRRARPGSLPVPRWCSALERHGDAAVAEVCSLVSWGGAPLWTGALFLAENPATRWLSALCRAGGGAAAGGEGGVPRTAVPSTGPLCSLCSLGQSERLTTRVKPLSG